MSELALLNQFPYSHRRVENQASGARNRDLCAFWQLVYRQALTILVATFFTSGGLPTDVVFQQMKDAP